MPFRFASLALLGLASCNSCRRDAVNDGASTEASPVLRAAVTSAALSLPIAADHDPVGRVYVAGYVAQDNTVDVSLFDAQARLMWHAPALDSLSFTSDAHVDVVAAPHGVVVIWRGLRHGKRTRVARWVADDGKPAAGTFDVAANACSVGDDLVSIGGKGSGAVLLKHLPDGVDRSVLSIPEGMDTTLVCGDSTRAYVIEEGDDDLAVRPISPADSKTLPRMILLSEDDLGDDEIREHEDFTTGESLGEVVLTEQGHFLLRQVDGTSGSALPKRTLDRTLAADEGFMTADGNKTHVAVVLTRDAGSRCDGDIGTDIVAIDVSLGTDSKERVVDIAHGECAKDLGPYWVATTEESLYVAWAVRGPRIGSRAPVEALVVTKLTDLTSKTIPLSGEDVLFAGCHADRCAFVALTRPAGTDGMVPGEARVILVP
jgi:hypothetical protein